MKTCYGIDVSDRLYYNRLGNLVNQFYKMLPLKEGGEPTLDKYMRALQREMLGCQGLIERLGDDPQYLSLLSILQYMIDHDCDVKTVRSDVFKAIGILKRMQQKLSTDAGGEAHGRVGQV